MCEMQDMDVCSQAVPSLMISYSPNIRPLHITFPQHSQNGFRASQLQGKEGCTPPFSFIFASKCQITLSLHHYCEASLHRDTIKITITQSTRRYCKHPNYTLSEFSSQKDFGKLSPSEFDCYGLNYVKGAESRSMFSRLQILLSCS